MNSKLMKAIFALLALALLGSILLSANAQDAPKPAAAPYALTADETKAWADLDAAEKQLARALDEAVAAAINTSVGDASKEIHGRISQAGLSLNLVQARRIAFLASLQARESCKGCQITDGKLVAPKPPEGKGK